MQHPRICRVPVGHLPLSSGISDWVLRESGVSVSFRLGKALVVVVQVPYVCDGRTVLLLGLAAVRRDHLRDQAYLMCGNLMVRPERAYDMLKSAYQVFDV